MLLKLGNARLLGRGARKKARRATCVYLVAGRVCAAEGRSSSKATNAGRSQGPAGEGMLGESW